jgi:hypothetical protein
MILCAIDGSVWFSGFIGAILGGLICGVVTGGFIYWQAIEVARHNLRSVVIRMGVHVSQCKGHGQGPTEPWTVYMDEAVSAYHRYRALIVWKKSRASLDKAWKAFKGSSDEESHFAFRGMLINGGGDRRARDFVDFLSK